ncbi:unnamed protein product [Sphacelaria rigidula]
MLGGSNGGGDGGNSHSAPSSPVAAGPGKGQPPTRGAASDAGIFDPQQDHALQQHRHRPSGNSVNHGESARIGVTPSAVAAVAAAVVTAAASASSAGGGGDAAPEDASEMIGFGGWDTSSSADAGAPTGASAAAVAMKKPDSFWGDNDNAGVAAAAAAAGESEGKAKEAAAEYGSVDPSIGDIMGDGDEDDGVVKGVEGGDEAWEIEEGKDERGEEGEDQDVGQHAQKRPRRE